MQDPAHAVRGFERERRTAAAVAIEPRAPVDQLAHVARALVAQDRHRRRIAQPVAGAHRVSGMQRGAVVGADRRGDAALRVAGVAFGRVRLGQDQHPADRRERDRGAQARDTAADDDEIVRIENR